MTGGAGYIGSHTCKFLYQNGYEPVVYDNLVSGHRSFVKWGDFIYGDILDTKKLIEVFNTYQPVAVIHFAAFAYVGESVENPAKYYLNNVNGTLSLLEAMRISGMNQIVFSSTCATYGNPKETPIPESHPQNPVNPYGRSKLIIENILKDFSDAYGLNYVALRYFNAAGADSEGEIGEYHDPETHLIPLVMDTALGIREKVFVYGNDYDTKDGTCIRDYIHVTDLAAAHYAALKYLGNGGFSDIFNLGNGDGHSVSEIIEKTKIITAKDFKVKIVDRRDGDPSTLIGDATKAKKYLNWSPRYTDINDILLSSWNWHLKLKKNIY